MQRDTKTRSFETQFDRGDERLQYKLLGPIEVHRDGEALDLGVRKQRAVLALLLINANKVVSTDRLIDELWADDSGRDRQNALWVNISRLRAALEPDRQKRTDGTILLTRSPGYVLSIDPSAIDSARFERLAVEGRALLDTDPAAASLVLSEALALWRGHALEEFVYDSFAQGEIARLEELRLATVEDRVSADLRVGRARDLVGELESLVRQNPLRESFTSQLMLALHRSGRQSDALRAFGALQTRLGEEVGLEPSPDITRLDEQILLDDPTLHQVDATRVAGAHADPGLSVRGYEMREKIGEGGLGHVYRAYQPAVGREVAIKVIRPELANDPDFIRRFEAEAQLVARLEHPQIVPLFDYWREPDAAFLVMRRFEDGSLQDALDAGPLSTEMACRVIEHVGAALAAAHRRGVTHGDIKPANVLIDGDGNAYLADFGMSFSDGDHGTAATAGSSLGAPFAAPEQWKSGEVSPRSDIYSLAVVAEHALRGSIGDGGRADSPLVGPAAEVITGATADDPADRFSDVESFIDALVAALGGPAADEAAELGDVENPYRGLRAFEEGDAGRFYGRERLAERLLARLGHSGPQGRMVTLVGPSGAGKSSVVRAGVIPALRQGALPGSDRWFIVTMTPGRHPFEALEDALLKVAVDPPAGLLAQLSSEGIAAAVRSVIPDTASQLLIVVDQLEELFSHATPRDASEFLAALADAASDRHSMVKIITTLRADFYDHPLRHGEFGELLRLGTEVITPMTAQELERATAAPAASVGVSFEAGLVAQVVSDMSGQAAALPLMQYALTELFEQRSGPTITSEAYRTLGGVSAALVRRADSLYEGLDSEARAATRDIFLRLVTLGEGSDDTRRRALLSELTAIGGDSVGAALDTFGRHRLLSFDRDPVTRGPTVEIAHEALLTEWKRLHHWIEDARADIQAQRRLASAAADWQERDRNPDFLLTGARFGRYGAWLEHPPVRLTADEQKFLGASGEAADAERNSERQRASRLRRLVAGIAVALVLALIAGGLALRAQNRADDEAQLAQEAATEAETQTEIAEEQTRLAVEASSEAEAQTEIAEEQTRVAVEAADAAELATLISRSAAASTEDSEISLLLALEAHRRGPGPETEQAVLNALGGTTTADLIVSRPALDTCSPFGVNFAPQFQGMTEFATVNGRLFSREAVSGEVVDQGPLPGEGCVIGGRDEQTGIASTLDGLRGWIGPNFEVEVEFDQTTFFWWSTIDRVLSINDPDFFEAQNTTVRLLDTATGEPVGPSHGGGIFFSGIANADGSLFAAAFARPAASEGDGRIIVIDAETGEEVFHLDFPTGAQRIAFDDASGQLIAGLVGGTIMTIDPASGEIVSEVQTNAADFLAIGIRPDGLIVGVGQGTVEVVDRRTGPTGVTATIADATATWVRPDGTIVQATQDGFVEVWDIDGSALIEETWPVEVERWVAFNAGRAGAIDTARQEAEIVDLSTGERTSMALTTPDGDTFPALVLYPEADGAWAVSVDHIAARWEGERMVEQVFMGSEDGVVGLRSGRSVSGTRLGDLYAALGQRRDGTQEASLVSLERGASGLLLTVETDDGAVVHPTLDGGLHVASADGTLRTYDSAGVLTGEIQTGALEPRFITLDPSSGSVAIAPGDGDVFVVDPTTKEIVIVASGDALATLGFARDGKLLALVLAGGTVRLWDLERAASAGLVWDGSGTLEGEPAWYDESTESIWVNASGKLLQIPLDPERWIERACEIAGRDLTQEEWDRLVPGDLPRHSACA